MALIKIVKEYRLFEQAQKRGVDTMHLDNRLTKIVNPMIEEARRTIFRDKTYDEVLIQLLWLFAEKNLVRMERDENDEPLWVATEELLAVNDQSTQALPSNVVDTWDHTSGQQGADANAEVVDLLKTMVQRWCV
jgi:hypothetical protein